MTRLHLFFAILLLAFLCCPHRLLAQQEERDFLQLPQREDTSPPTRTALPQREDTSPPTLQQAGSQPPWQQYLDELSEMEDFAGSSWENYEDVLNDYAEHPININAATREDLEQFPFLTAQQIQDILAYIYRYGAMKSLGELAMIKSISWYQRQLLAYFVYTEDADKHKFPCLKSIARYGKHELVAALKIPCYERKGDNDGYMGYPYKHWLRYQFRYGNYVKAGFLGAQDAGEPFFAGRNKQGYDFYSFYLQVSQLGRLKNLTLGRYRVHEGMGLILNNDFSFGKLSMLSSLGRNANTIRVHSSRYAANYLQGAAATVLLCKGLDVSAFLSSRKIDATVKDSGITTIITNGLHRTETEMAKKNVATVSLIGGNVNYRLHDFHIGLTGFYTTYSMPLTPNTRLLYKRHAPVGSNFWNASVDYGYTGHGWTLAGETATGNCGVVATINSASYRFSEHLSLLALQRFYPARYYSLYSNSFAEGSDEQDESGIYLGGTWSPNSQWIITAYTDFAYFAWPKYGTTGSTSAWDNLLNVTFRPSASMTIGSRYRFKRKQSADTHRIRLYATQSSGLLTNRLSVDLTLSRKPTAPSSKGYLLSDAFSLKRKWLQVSGRIAYFHTDDYNARIYSYEQGMLYELSSASYYGHGIRYALMAKAEIGKRLVCVAKAGTTNYFDRNHIASGLQQIDRSSQTDVEVQIKVKL